MKTKEKEIQDITAPGQVDPKDYPEFTADWPKDKLKAAIKGGLESGNSGVSSLAKYRKAFARNSR